MSMENNSDKQFGKLSELINELQQCLNFYGDIDVYVADAWCAGEIKDIKPCVYVTQKPATMCSQVENEQTKHDPIALRIGCEWKADKRRMEGLYRELGNPETLRN